MTENLAARGEGLAGLRERLTEHFRRIGMGNACQLADIAMAEAAAPASTPAILNAIGICLDALTTDNIGIIKAAIRHQLALATPSPQAPDNQEGAGWYEQEQCNASSTTSAREQSSATASVPLRHGVNCEKKPHVRDGYLHGEEDDTPYDVDGVKYCGRCHIWLDTVPLTTLPHFAPLTPEQIKANEKETISLASYHEIVGSPRKVGEDGARELTDYEQDQRRQCGISYGQPAQEAARSVGEPQSEVNDAPKS